MSKTYLIIGASSDVGAEVLVNLNNTTKNSIFVAHYRTSLDKINKIELKNGNSMIKVQADLSKEESVKDLIMFLKKQEIVPNAIVHLPAPKLEYIKYKDLRWEECEEDAFVQVASIMLILQAFLPQMVKFEDFSKVVFVLSENTINKPAKFTTKYTMSKYMLLGLMNSLVAEYEGKKVNINAVSPSMIDTKLLNLIDRRLLDMSGATEQMLLPQDVASVICRLLSNESDMVNGENIYIPGRGKEN